MKPIQTFTVSPALPKKLKALHEIAYNLHWSWRQDNIELFRHLDRHLWEESGHNPVVMLGQIDQQTFEELSKDEGFLAHYKRVHTDLQDYMNHRTTWYRKTYGEVRKPVIAYFSAEFGITECVPIYSGGLGMLAGDHLKSASELGIPLVGVGLLYQQGYFCQYLNADGWQQESYPENDFYTMPIELQCHEDGTPITIAVEYPGRNILARIWRAQIGRISLYLLDTNFEANHQEDQDIVDQLYGGDSEMRVQQEIMLGIGGMRALAALGIEPLVCHMNEGHSAFLVLERIRILMTEHGLSFLEAREVTAASHVFTTHTPVAAGHDYFDPALIQKYFRDYYQKLHLSLDEFLALGRQHPDDQKELFCMTILAMRLSHCRNAVSRLHGSITKRMWMTLWPGVPEHEIPISYVTNGVHSSSWISKEMAELFQRYLGPRWREQPAEPTAWKGIEEIPAVELWDTHEKRRERLIVFVRRRLRAQITQRGGSLREIEAAEEVLDPDILTIGFARRFATYKRANLLLRDEERFKKLLTDPERPMQILFAGKAHPKDEQGKQFIRKIIHFARQDDVHRHIVFIENYDMDVARYLVQGVDVWLNTPIRLREASGTSGMKAAFNGAINLSILDGWWDEAYRPEVGWAIGQGEDYDDPKLQDEVESHSLYDLLEKDVIPTFYDRGRDGLPRHWIALMKSSMAQLCPVFNTNRMVQEYTEKFYVPAAKHFKRFSKDGFKTACNLIAWKTKIEAHWSQVKIQQVEENTDSSLKVGETIEVNVKIYLGELTPEDVLVELYLGRLDTKGNIIEPKTVEMTATETDRNESNIFSTRKVKLRHSGRHGYTVRVMPRHKDLVDSLETGLITWA